MNKKVLVLLAGLLQIGIFTSHANLLANGDFETGTPTADRSATFDAPPWQRYIKLTNYNSWLTDGSFDPAVGEGNQALEFRWGVTYIYQEIPVSPGISYDFYTEVLNAYGAQEWDGNLRVEWLDGAGAKIGATDIIGTYPGQTGTVGSWVPLFGTRVAPAGAEEVRVVMMLVDNGDSTKQRLYFDNASVIVTGSEIGAPVSSNNVYGVVEDELLVVAAPGVLGNDTDPDDDALTAVLIGDVSHGALTLESDGSFVYQPETNFFGPDAFTYRAYDGSLYGNLATVSIEVSTAPTVPVAPVALADAYSVVRGSELNVTDPGVLMNDEDANGDELSAMLVSDITSGSLNLGSNGSFDFTPAVGFTGTVSFTYASVDGSSTGNTATATIQVLESIAAERPNILIFFADDMGRGDSRVYNHSANLPPAQPTIEAFAASGMVFNDAHTQASLCAPSRYCLLTGNYPWRGRLEGGSWHMNKGAQVMPGQRTLAHVLNSAGYHTSIFGKGHLGGYLNNASGTPDTRNIVWDLGDARDYLAGDTSLQDNYYDPTLTDWSQPVSNGVCSALVGFDFGYMLYGGIQDPLYAYFENDYIVGNPADLEVWDNPHYMTANGDHWTYRPGYGITNWTTCDVGPSLTQKTMDFIDAHVATNQANGTDDPFFIHYCAEAVHSPHTPPIDFLGTPVAGTTDYPHSDMLFELDVAFSNILAKLDEKGILNDTLVIFTSDNGGLGISEADSGHNPNEGLRGYKASIWEGGHSVPLFVKWGDKISAGSYDPVVGIHDLYATIAQLVGKQQGASQGLDAVSLLSVLLQGNTAPVRDNLLFIGNSVSTDPFAFNGRALREGSYKLIWDKNNNVPLYLYDLATDPAESIDLLADPAQAVRLARMTEKMDGYVALTIDPTRFLEGRSEPLPPLRDLNENGMDDDWETFYFGSTNAVNGGAHDDYDLDTLENLFEFAFGSDPTVIDDPTTVLPDFGISGDTFEYVYRRRQDAAARNLCYTPEQSENLLSNSWSTGSLTEVGSGFVDADIETVTNHFPMAGTTNRFFQLKLEMQ